MAGTMPKKCLLSWLKKKVKKKHKPTKRSYVAKQNSESDSSYASDDDGYEVKNGNSTNRSMTPNRIVKKDYSPKRYPPTNQDIERECFLHQKMTIMKMMVWLMWTPPLQHVILILKVVHLYQLSGKCWHNAAEMSLRHNNVPNLSWHGPCLATSV